MDMYLQDRLTKVNTVNTIVSMAEAEIFRAVGMKYRLLIVGEVPDVDKTAKSMAQVIAGALGMNYGDMANASRRTEYVQLRQLVAYFLKQYYPLLTLHQIKAVTGHGDHTTVLHSLRTVKEQLDRQEEGMCMKYEQVLAAVTQWMRE